MAVNIGQQQVVSLDVRWSMIDHETYRLLLGATMIFGGEVWTRSRLGNGWTHSRQNPPESILYPTREGAMAALLAMLVGLDMDPVVGPLPG